MFVWKKSKNEVNSVFVVLAIAQNVGSANVLIPAIEMLFHQGTEKIAVVASDTAISIFEKQAIAHETIPPPQEDKEPESEQKARDLLERIRPDILLLGTAWGLSWDKILIPLARDRNIPSVVVLDMWSNYRERFTHPPTGQVNLPTKIALMDEVALEQAIAAGLPPENLVITGQPYLETLPSQLQHPEIVEQAKQLRQSWQSSSPASKIILFASESFARDYGVDTPHYRGYTEIDALDGLVRAIEEVEKQTQSHWEIVVKLHPDQPLESFQPNPLARRKIRTIANAPSLACLKAADVIVGMTSMFLLESAFARQPTLSFQPGVRKKEDFIGTRIGIVPTATSVEELAALLVKSKIVKSKKSPHLLTSKRFPGFEENQAATKIAKILKDLAR